MTFLKKATVAFAAMSMVAAPVAASAAPAASFDGLRASSELADSSARQGEGGGISAWLLAAFAAAAIIAGAVVASDGSSNAPTSP